MCPTQFKMDINVSSGGAVKFLTHEMYKVRLTLLPTEEHVFSLDFNSCKIVLNFESTPDQLVLILFY